MLFCSITAPNVYGSNIHCSYSPLQILEQRNAAEDENAVVGILQH